MLWMLAPIALAIVFYLMLYTNKLDWLVYLIVR